jgi:hypothetical protein
MLGRSSGSVQSCVPPALHTGHCLMCSRNAARATDPGLGCAADFSNRLPSSQSHTLITYSLLGEADSIPTFLFVGKTYVGQPLPPKLPLSPVAPKSAILPLSSLGPQCARAFYCSGFIALSQSCVLLIRKVDVVAATPPSPQAVLKFRQIFYVAAEDKCT